MEYFTAAFPNGIRIIHKAIRSEVAHFGVIFNTGSRDEREDQHGMAHFIEHALFKGTARRKSYHILTRLEHVGGDLNAYTGKEETFIHASFLKQYYPRAIELFYDILFQASFPEKEIRKESEVILEEIQSYRDNPNEAIFDEFEDLVFDGHALGRNILGTPESIRNYGRDQVREFVQDHYHTDRMVICSVGNIGMKALMQMLEKYFSGVPARLCAGSRQPFCSYRPVTRSQVRNTYQTHLMTGGLAVSLMEENRVAMALLNNVLGGPGMNSRLNMSLRERNGLAYNIESVFTPFCDTGVFGIYAGIDDGDLDRVIRLIHKELNKLRDTRLGTLQMKMARQQLIGQVAISLESNLNELLSIGKSYLVYNRADSPAEISRRIEAVTPDQLLELAERVFQPHTLCTLIFRSSESRS